MGNKGNRNPSYDKRRSKVCIRSASKVSTFRGPIKGCGITISFDGSFDGSNDATINICGLNDYGVPIPTWRSNKTLNTELAGDLEGQSSSESECYTEGILSNTGLGSESEIDSEAVASSEVGPEGEHSPEMER